MLGFYFEDKLQKQGQIPGIITYVTCELSRFEPVAPAAVVRGRRGRRVHRLMAHYLFI